MKKRTIDNIGAASDFKGKHIKFDEEEIASEEVELIMPNSPASNPSTSESHSSEEHIGGIPTK